MIVSIIFHQKKEIAYSILLEVIAYTFYSLKFSTNYQYFLIIPFLSIFFINFLILNYLHLRYKYKNILSIFRLKFLCYLFLYLIISIMRIIFNNINFIDWDIELFIFNLFLFSLTKEILISNFFIFINKKIINFHHSILNKNILKKIAEEIKYKRLNIRLIYNDKNRINENYIYKIKAKSLFERIYGNLIRFSKFKVKKEIYINIEEFNEKFFQKIPLYCIENINLTILVKNLNNSFYYKYVKRFFDVFFSFLLLTALMPIILVASLAIKISDKGPILYSQNRTGKGKIIKIFKFRSMKVDAEKDGVQWAQNNDPRITKIGRFLRKTRIDELPQLLSVIKGDMSLIGPRPERPQFDINLEKEIINYNYRYSMKPGLSGWAQVNYPYGSSIEDAKIKLEYDFFYLKNYSFLLDTLILFKTIKIILLIMGSTPKESMF